MQSVSQQVSGKVKPGIQSLPLVWSNSCFEYWLLLHFKADDVARKPPEWRNRVDTEMKKAGLIHVDYDKANTELSDMPTIDGLLKRTVENASRREKKQKASVASIQDPGTTVHHLIASLSPYMQELLQMPDKSMILSSLCALTLLNL